MNIEFEQVAGVKRPRKRPLQVPDDLSAEEKLKLRAWVDSGSCPVDLAGRELKLLVDTCLDHYRALGNPKKYKDWLAVCRNWIRREYKFAQQRHSKVALEMPRERRSPSTEGMAEIGQVLELFPKDKESA